MQTSATSPEVSRGKQSVLWAARTLVESGALSLSQHGNISVRVPGSDAFILTGGGTLDNMAEADLALLDLNGRVIDGDLSPASAEIIQMHAAIYRERGDVGCVIHTHSPHVTTYAIANKPLPPVYEAMLRFDVTEPVPVAQYGPRGSERSVQNILDVLRPSTKAVLLANHGILAFDRDAESTVRLIFALEEAAEFTLKATSLGGAQEIPPELRGEALKRRDPFLQESQAVGEHPSVE